MPNSTASAPTLEELQTQLADLRARHDDAANRASALRDRRGRMQGLQLLGEATEEEVKSAANDASDAADAVEALEAAISELERRVTEAEEAARAAHLATVRTEGEEAARERTAALQRLRRALDAVGGAVEQFDAANGTITRAAAQLRNARQVDVDQIEDAYRAVVNEAEGNFAREYRQAEAAGATPGPEPGSAFINVELRSEARQAATARRDAALSAAGTTRAASLASLGIVSDDGEDALSKAASEFAPLLKRLVPQEHREAVAELLRYASETGPVPMTRVISEGLTSTGEPRADRGKRLGELRAILGL